MSRRRGQSGLEVSLFPFLAVLVCAMGSLILLLLIITRNVHPSFQRQESAEVEPLEETSPVRFSESLRESLETSVSPIVAQSEIGSARFRKLQAAPLPMESLAGAPEFNPLLHAAQPVRDRLEAKREAERRLTEERAQLERHGEELEAELIQLAGEIEQTKKAMSQLQQQLNQMESQDRGLQADVEKKALAVDTLQAEIQFHQQMLKAAEQEKQDQKNNLQIVAFDGQTGQKRQPIFVECRRDTITLHPEGIAVPTGKLKNYSPSGNPMAEALLAYASKQVELGNRNEEPYILLVVSPDGVDEFYVMGQLLRANGIEFGYELVGKTQEFYFGKPDERLAATFAAAFEKSCLQPTVEPEAIPSQMVGRPGRTGYVPPDVEVRDRNGQGFPSGSAAHAQGRPQNPAAGGSQRGSGDASDPDWPAGMPPSSSVAGAESGQPAHSGGHPAIELPEPGTWSAAEGQNAESSMAQSQASGRKSQEDPLAKLLNPFATGHNGGAGSPQSGSAGRSGAAPTFTTIGIEQPLVVNVDATGFQVGSGRRIEIPDRLDQERVRREMYGAIAQEMSSWGAAPDGMHWSPVLEYRVLPGGNLMAVSLERLTDQTGVHSTTRPIFSDRVSGLDEEAPLR
ncbi:hypothetical protein [Rubinisphaera margarita]|uniref:hypothetical protein n=1 Tax=Rubinisphaera margarita TaxID=2909586 RepID=UPI001EE79780|nr:hypothetical protein [Rubinisphaera margarita]MCG6156242.1 hypothetical protein [Rubinisphaera margarita]